MRTVTLELLRHGPPHNQLLSPLTPYLALCENHAAVTVHMPFEHDQLLHRLGALGYQMGEDPRAFQVKDVSAILSQILSTIPGLTAELNRRDGSEDAATHLRLIISGSELALLPFELALAPAGFPGAGQSLLLQSQVPICLTREVRRVGAAPLRWPDAPRILFAAASPLGVDPVPMRAHLLALRRAIDPWVWSSAPGDAEGLRRRVNEHLVCLPRASLAQIEDACQTGRFTHVHLLAHGVENRSGFDVRYGLALHDPDDPDGPADVVGGPRLAGALRPATQPDRRDLARPAVVTLASCHSANVGSVSGAGASLAHSLHDADIPMVVAGQFPLSFDGSVEMVETLYEGLLWGADPRRVLVALRRRLHSRYKVTHDWASLTAYASFPTGFDRDLFAVQASRARQAINAAMNHADAAIRGPARLPVPGPSPNAAKGPDPDEGAGSTGDDAGRAERLDAALQRVAQARDRLAGLLGREPAAALGVDRAQRAHLYLLLASTEKRLAQLYFSALGHKSLDQGWRMSQLAASFKALERSRQLYWTSLLHDQSGGWGAAQYVSLTLVLNLAGKLPPSELDAPERHLGNLWTTAKSLSLIDLHNSQEDSIYANAQLAELYVLSLLNFPEGQNPRDKPSAEEASELAMSHARAVAQGASRTAGTVSWALYSTRTGFERYRDWFGHWEVTYGGLEPILPLVRKVIEVFPETAGQEWK